MANELNGQKNGAPYESAPKHKQTDGLSVPLSAQYPQLDTNVNLAGLLAQADAFVASIVGTGTVAATAPAGGQMPVTMLTAKRWLLHKEKVPHYLNGSRRAGAQNTPEDWEKLGTWEQARDAYRISAHGEYDGFGFALGPDGTGGHWQGADLDKLPRDQMEPSKNAMPGYTEISPSGRGLHAIGYGRVFETLSSNGSGVEAYAKGQFFTVTGDEGYGELTDIAEFVEQKLTQRHASCRTGNVEANSVHVVPVDAETITDLRSALKMIPCGAGTYATWTAMGHALRELGGVGRELWLTWSEQFDGFKMAEASKKWDQLGSGERTGYQAVFAEAQRQGWLNPNSNAARAKRDSAAPKQGTHRYKAVRAQEMAARPNVQWLVKGIIPTTGIGSIYGAPGSGKSFLVLDLLAAVSEGDDWFDRLTRKVKVAYLVLEGKGGIPQRVKAYRKQVGAMDDVLFFDDRIDLRDDQCRADLIESLKAEGYADGILCIDTLAASAPGMDENTSTDMGALIAHFGELQEALGGFVMVIHHSGKDQGRGPRGWSGLVGALDTGIEVTHADKKDPNRSFSVRKSKDGRDGQEFGFQLLDVDIEMDEDGDKVTSCVVTPGPRAPGESFLVDAYVEPIVALISQLADNGTPVSTGKSGPGNTFKTLSEQPSFPQGLKRDMLNAVLARAETLNRIAKATFPSKNRNTKEVWTAR